MLHGIIPSLRSVLRRLLRRDTAAPKPAVSPPIPSVAREDVERLIGQPVGDMAVFEQALLHRSLLRGTPDSYLLSNERLEFLGDAVLGFVVAEYLYQHFPDRDEGFLTRLRSKIVNGEALAEYARRLELGRIVLISDNMFQAGGRDNPTILADAFEAIIGALYLDQGDAAARQFIANRVLAELDLEELAEQRDNHKSQLLEQVQGMGWPQPEYRVLQEEGPSHDKIFTVEVFLKDEAYGRGRAGSKKKAEQEAAGEALQRLIQEAADAR